MNKCLLGTLAILSLVLIPQASAGVAPSVRVVDLRVGLISYDLAEEKVQTYQSLFNELSDDLAGLNISANPTFAVGTYADVLDWISRGLVDVAVLSPSAFAETRQARSATQTATTAAIHESIPDCVYIATEGKVPADNDSWVNNKLKSSTLPDRCRFEYNSFCIVSKDSSLRTFDDLTKAAANEKVQFVFGDPLSASSAILPMHILHSHGIDFRKHMEYTFGQADSVHRLTDEPWLILSPEKKLERVGFVYDLALKNPKETPSAFDNPSNFRKIDIPLAGADTQASISMTDILLPMEVWVARKGFDEAKIEAIRKLLLNHHAHRSVEGKPFPQPREEVRGPNGQVLIDFANHKDKLEERFKPLCEWAKDVRTYMLDQQTVSDTEARLSGMKFPVRFEDIISLARHYDLIHEHDGKKSRLALVLAGGGAKCAYEAGVVNQLENTLGYLRSTRSQGPRGQNAQPGIDIDLVVGTSGGALNAVPIAAGVSEIPGPTPLLYSTWKDLNAFDILRPPIPVQFVLGICYTFFYFVAVRGLLLLIGRWKPGKHEITSVRSVAILLIIVPFLFFVLFFFPALLHPLLLLPSKLLFYLALALSCGVFYWALLSILCGAVIWLNEPKVNAPDLSAKRKADHRGFFAEMLSWADPRHPVPIWRFLAVGTMLIGLASILASFNKEGLFRGSPLANTVTKRYTDLFAVFTGRSKSDLEKEKIEKRRQIISEAAYKRILTGHRDLVITGSSLSENSRGTKYFYIQAENPRNRCEGMGCDRPSYGTYGIEIGHDCDRNQLVDIAIGSGTIFPIFPSHEVKGSAGDSMILIDGGFAHNTPIEAAVRWGATHIILIEVSPETPARGDRDANFITNAFTAFNYLYDQAQLADVNAQEEAAVFVLRPQVRNDGPSIGLFDFSAWLADYELRWGSSDAALRKFVRQAAQPHFWPTQASK
jgi:predicted acylesterase/phospholipase RssA/ABC-type phosphate/phosphonate transport system substrate-binding protein